jgi:hypothetical protein
MAISLEMLGALMERMQIDIRAMSIKLDILSRSREQDLAALVTRPDLNNLIDVLAEHLNRIDAHLERIESKLGRVPSN